MPVRPALLPPSRGRGRPSPSRLAIAGAAATLVVATSLGSASVALAAPGDPITVTTPADGATGVQQTFPAVAQFAGGNVPTGEQAYVTYKDEKGTSHPATFGGGIAGDDGTWSGGENFGDASPGQTTFTATVVARDADSGDVDTSAPAATVTFTFAEAPVPVTPFAVTDPANGSTVDSTTPAFTGTGEAGTTVTLNYSGIAAKTYVAGTATIDGDGNWTIPATDFSSLEPGATSVRINVVDSDGKSFFHNISFTTAPNEAQPVTLKTAPNPVNLTQATTIGVAFTGSGLSPDEEYTVAVTDSDGTAVPLAPAADHFYADDTDGSFEGLVKLPTSATPDTYTVTVTGVRSGREASGDLVVRSDADLPYGVTATPSTLTQTQSSTGGTVLSITGFGDDEDIALVVVGPDGKPVDLGDADIETDGNGSADYQLILPSGSALGTYSVSVVGATSARAARTTFSVIADSTPGTTPGGGTPGGGMPGGGSLPIVSG